MSLFRDSHLTIKNYTEIKKLKDEFIELEKTFNSKNECTFEIYQKLDEKFDDIQDKLKNLKSFNHEFEYFLSVKDKILYIIYKNCEDSSFGHCDFALDLINFFKEVWEAKISLYENYSETQLKKYGELQNSFKKRYHKYREIFYYEIYEFSGEFSEEELYKIHESLRE